MTLIELQAHWLKQNDRSGVGVCFNCPCGCGDRCCVYFENPLDNQPMIPIEESGNQKCRWKREGDTLNNITLTPSVNWLEYKDGPSHWHGFVKDGKIE